MRMRTATSTTFRSCAFTFSARMALRALNVNWSSSPAFVLFALFLAFLGSFLGALAMAGADLRFGHGGTGLEHALLAHSRQHLDAFEHAHISNLPHDCPHRPKLVEELLDLVRLGAAADGDAAPAAEVDDVGVELLLL